MGKTQYYILKNGKQFKTMKKPARQKDGTVIGDLECMPKEKVLFFWVSVKAFAFHIEDLECTYGIKR